MSFLLDTNVISELRKGERTDRGVSDWFTSVSGSDLFLSVLVIGELRRGVERMRRRDPVGASALSQWLARITEGYADRILPVDSRVAEQWGRLNVPDPVPAIDGLLAATAIVHDLTLVTRNVTDVERTGAMVLNPFTNGQGPAAANG